MEYGKNEFLRIFLLTTMYSIRWKLLDKFLLIIVLTTKHTGRLICEYLWYLCDLYKHSGWISCEYLWYLCDSLLSHGTFSSP